LVNIGVFDPAPSKGAFRNVPAFFHENIEDALKLIQNKNYNIYALTTEAENSLEKINFQENSAFIVGHEEKGFSFDIKKYEEIKPVKISLYGSMQSLNVSVAASIAMYEFTKKQSGLL
tara:strand:+ start:3747 stop:4100 length:354 start_codon:yes stop_codon:yes gene_type:complete